MHWIEQPERYGHTWEYPPQTCVGVEDMTIPVMTNPVGQVYTPDGVVYWAPFGVTAVVCTVPSPNLMPPVA